MSNKYLYQVDIERNTGSYFETYEAAEKYLKRKAIQDTDEVWYIYQAIAKAEAPLPAIEVVKL